MREKKIRRTSGRSPAQIPRWGKILLGVCMLIGTAALLLTGGGITLPEGVALLEWDIRGFWNRNTEQDFPEQPLLSPLQICMMDVGEGDCLLFLAPNGDAMLVDAGPTACAERVAACLDRFGVTKLKYLFLTHFHEDHIGAAAALLYRYPVETVLFPDGAVATAESQQLLSAMEICSSSRRTVWAGESVSLGDAQLQVLFPRQGGGNTADPNDGCMVLQVTYGGIKMLLMGDAGEEVERALLASLSADELRSDLIKVGHHGAKDVCSAAFLASVKPKLALISCKASESAGHPAVELLTRLEQAKVSVYRTDLLGNILLQTDGVYITVQG